MDETWIHHYTPETKRSSAEWKVAGESRPKRPHSTVGWQGYGIIRILGRTWNLFIDCLEKGETIDSDYYMALLDRLSAEIKKKRLHMQKKSCSTKTMHRATSPWKRWSNWMNYALNCFLTHHILHIWPSATIRSLLSWKNAPGKEFWLQWRSDCRNWGLFESKDETFYKKDNEKLEKHWNKCITLEGNYVNEYSRISRQNCFSLNKITYGNSGCIIEANFERVLISF